MPATSVEDISVWLDAWADAVRPARADVLAIASFELLQLLAPHAGGREKAAIWSTLAHRIHRRFPHWSATGPDEVADGALVFWGGIPRGDTVIFREDGEVFFTKRGLRPGPTWQPDYATMQRLEAYLTAHRDISHRSS